MSNRMNKSVRNWLILATLIVVAILAAFWAITSRFMLFGRRPLPPFEIPWDIEFFYIAQTVISTINMVLSIFLLLIYASIYTRTRSEFTIGLIIFSAVLLLHALVSVPLVQRAFGFPGFGLGPFAMLPDLFTLAALAVLLYLSIKY